MGLTTTTPRIRGSTPTWGGVVDRPLELNRRRVNCIVAGMTGVPTRRPVRRPRARSPALFGLPLGKDNRAIDSGARGHKTRNLQVAGKQMQLAKFAAGTLFYPDHPVEPATDSSSKEAASGTSPKVIPFPGRTASPSRLQATKAAVGNDDETFQPF